MRKKMVDIEGREGGRRVQLPSVAEAARSYSSSNLPLHFIVNIILILLACGVDIVRQPQYRHVLFYSRS